MIFETRRRVREWVRRTGIAIPILTGMLLAAATRPVFGAGDARSAIDCNIDALPPSIHCGTTPSAVFDHAGRLWAAFEHGDFVYVTSSGDRGRTFRPATRVYDEAEALYTNGENRPKIAIGRNRELFVSWTRITPGPFAGDIRFSRSLDGGGSFSPPLTVNDDGLVTSHRFETLYVDTGGIVYLSWIDKRDLLTERAADRPYAGAAVYYTVSHDAGASFTRNRKVADSSCECCRIAMAEGSDGNVAIFFRHIFGANTRDHGFAMLGRDAVAMPVVRATYDDWRIDACPHHGPSMVADPAGGFHLSWFTAGQRNKGIYYGRFDPAAKEMRGTRSMTEIPSAGHPSLATVDDLLLLAWKSFDGDKTAVNLVLSPDGGRSWEDARPIASTSGASDHPYILTHGSDAYLSWQTAAEGYRLVHLDLRPQEGGR